MTSQWRSLRNNQYITASKYLIFTDEELPIDVEEVVDFLVELLKVSRQDTKDEIEKCRGAYVRLAWLRDTYHSKCDARQWTLAAGAYYCI